MRLKFMGYRQAVRQRVLISSCAGSNPAIPAIHLPYNTVLQITLHRYIFKVIYGLKQYAFFRLRLDLNLPRVLLYPNYWQRHPA